MNFFGNLLSDVLLMFKVKLRSSKRTCCGTRWHRLWLNKPKKLQRRRGNLIKLSILLLLFDSLHVFKVYIQLLKELQLVKTELLEQCVII